ncbi:MAG: TonB-dependent receptor [Alphaproteobacteria bacterium]|nr:TonB-dependent receptor [Alphaproteobacteria bacterium]
MTATGRAAAIQDVPLAVTAVSGDTLENSGANDLRDVTQVAPSLSMGTGQSNSSGTSARIRGIGTGSDNPGFESAVGIFIDGVYRARAGAALADLPELERVEILRGPQGTLFGRNTSAGAISVVTAGPDYDPGMYIEGTYGFDDLEEYGLRAGVNIPVTDSFAMRFDGSVRERAGYITDIVSGDDINDRNRWTGRAQFEFDVSPDASVRIIADAAGTDEVCCGTTPLIYGQAQGALAAVAAGVGLGAFVSPPIDVGGRHMAVTPALPGLPALGPGLPAQSATNARGYGEETNEEGISAQVDWDLGNMNFTSITAFRHWDATRSQDIDFGVVDIAYRDGLDVTFENFTQEFRLQGENGPLNWLVGVFYGDEDLDTRDTIRIGAHANLYANALTQGNTVDNPFIPGTQAWSLIGGPGPAGCQLYDSSAAADPDSVPSVFYCLSDNPLTPAVFDPNPLLANTYLIGNTAGQGQQNDSWSVATQSLSVFTHNEISLGENLVWTIGLRYNQEDKDMTASLLSTSNSCDSLRVVEFGTGGLITSLLATPFAGIMNIACNPAVNPIVNGNWASSRSEEEFSGTTSLAYHLNSDTMLYGGYSRGYKAGGFNVDRSGFPITPATLSTAGISADRLGFEPEFTDAYEIGLKATIFGGTTTVNVAGFYQQIHDYQLNAFNGFNFITRNISEAISQGAELEISSRPTDNLTLTGGVVYTDAFYDVRTDFNLPGVADPFGRNVIESGTPFAFAPEWTVTGGIAYEQPLGGNLRALFYLDGRWNSEYRTQTLSREATGATDNEAYAIFNGRIGIGPENERWSVELWGRNLLDETYYVGAFVPPLQDSNSSLTFSNYTVYPNEPATYGVSLRLQY